MVNDLNPCILLELCESHVFIHITTTQDFTKLAHRKPTQASASHSFRKHPLMASAHVISVSLHKLSAVMDDEDDRHLLDILG